MRQRHSRPGPTTTPGFSSSLHPRWRSSRHPAAINETLEQRRLLSCLPSITAARFDFESLDSYGLYFTLDPQVVVVTLEDADVRLERVTAGEPPTRIDVVFSDFDFDTNTAKFTLPSGPLPDGNYRAAISKQDLSDSQVNDQPRHLVADVALDFFVFAGDANHDRTVNLQDFNVVAANFGQSPRTFSQGDFNYDSVVNLLDFNILAARFGTSLPAPPQAPVETSVTPSTTGNGYLVEWVDTVSGEANWHVQRSTDGQNFSLYQVLPANSTSYHDAAATSGVRYWYRARAAGNGQDSAYSVKRYPEFAIQTRARDFFENNPDDDFGADQHFTDLRQGYIQTLLGPDGNPRLKQPWTLQDAQDISIRNPATFAQWFEDTPGHNIGSDLALNYSLATDGTYRMTNHDPTDAFFPLTECGQPQNFLFTVEAQLEFVYRSGQTYEVTSDDDLWIFIDGRLVTDLGGIHFPAPDSVNMNQVAATLGLVEGQTYSFALFYAERHMGGATFDLRTNFLLSNPPDKGRGSAPAGRRFADEADEAVAHPQVTDAGAELARRTFAAGQPVSWSGRPIATDLADEIGLTGEAAVL